MWHVLLAAPLVAPLLWNMTRSLSWILIFLPILAIYSETLPRDDHVPFIYPLEWQEKPPTEPPVNGEDAVSRLAHFIVRDFIKSWHSILVDGSDDEDSASFPRAVSQLLSDVLHRILTRIEQVDLSTLLMQRVLPTLREHVEKYRSAQNSLRGVALSKEDPAFHDWYLAAKYQQGDLHPAVGNTSSLDTKESEHDHLRILMNRFISAFTQDTMCLGRIEAALLREILACSILYPVINMVSDPDWIHLQVTAKAAKRLHELAQVDRVRESLSASASEPRLTRKPLLHDYPASSPRHRRRNASRRTRSSRLLYSNAKKTSTYERYLMRIESTKSSLDLRRIRHELLNEILRNKEELLNNPSKAYKSDYVEKLEPALQIAEKRFAELGCSIDSPEPSHDLEPGRSQELGKITLSEILRNFASLPFLLEFMDLRGRAVLPRFWVFVDAFKNPLEEVESDLSFLDAESLLKEVVHTPDAGMYASTQSLKESMELVLQYCNSPLLRIRESCREVVETFLTLENSAGVQERGLFIVRQCVLLMQADVMQIMLDQDWEPFTLSHLYMQAADQVRQNHVSAEKTHNVTVLDWDIESDYLLGEEHLSSPSGHQKDARIPFRYGFLMGSGDGTKSQDPALFRKPLFETDPLFVDDASSVPMATKMRQPYLSKQHVSMPQGMSPDVTESTNPGMDLAWMRHQQTTSQLRSLRCQCEQLHHQQDKIDTLLKKAELTGASTQEIQLLQTSRKAIERDIRTAEWETNYLENLLHQHGHIFDAKHATHVSIEIKDTEECKDQAGHAFILYHILVRMSMVVGGSQDKEYTWVISRRYSAFRELHQSLKHQFRSIWACESLFPGKKLMGSMNSAFVESRRRSLERYLIVCQSPLTHRQHWPFQTSVCPGPYSYSCRM